MKTLLLVWNGSILLSQERLVMICSIQVECGPWNILIILTKEIAVPGTSWYDFLFPRGGWSLEPWYDSIQGECGSWNIMVWFPLPKERAGRFLEHLGMNCSILLSLEHLGMIFSIQGEGGSWNILVWFPLSEGTAVPGTPWYEFLYPAVPETSWYDLLYPRRGWSLEHLGKISSTQEEGGSWNTLVWFPLSKERTVPGTSWYELLYPAVPRTSHFLYPRRGWSLEHLGMISSLSKERAVPGTSWYDLLYPRRRRSLEPLGMNCSIPGGEVPGTTWYELLYPRRAIPGTSWYMNCFVPEEGGPWNHLVWTALFPGEVLITIILPFRSYFMGPLPPSNCFFATPFRRESRELLPRWMGEEWGGGVDKYGL